MSTYVMLTKMTNHSRQSSISYKVERYQISFYCTLMRTSNTINQ